MPPTLASDPDLLPEMIFLTLIVWSIVFILVTYWRLIMTLEADWAAMDSGDAWLPAVWCEKRRDTGARTNITAGVVTFVEVKIVAVMPSLGPRNQTGADNKDEHIRAKDHQNGGSDENRSSERINISHHAIPNMPTPGTAHTHSQQPLHRIHTTRKVEAWMHACPTPKDQRCPRHHTHFDEEDNDEETQDELDGPSSTSLDKTSSTFSAASSSETSEVENQEAPQIDENANKDLVRKDGDVDVDVYDSSETSTSSSDVVYTPPESDSDSL
ncbi:hypothetical protein FB567DRAFT_587798 [Paraphoma chrysanthemicola]|uniref:Uncharacterized protein n=1 Tax=Paraphoma chrysanthemicola TaxID=798071 RepID=A0A8K0W3I9_9PLEO|nr:hypothetical protein FB567DRAFT_587798 [Paraphoma chrysanthemicola]